MPLPVRLKPGPLDHKSRALVNKLNQAGIENQTRTDIETGVWDESTYQDMCCKCTLQSDCRTCWTPQSGSAPGSAFV